MKNPFIHFPITFILLFLFTQSESFGQQFPSYNLSKQQIKYLCMYTKAVGIVKYFHPTEKPQKTNWAVFTHQGVREVFNISNDTDFVDFMNRHFLKLSPYVKFLHTPDEKKLESVNKVKEDLYKSIIHEKGNLSFWQHTGLGMDREGKYIPFLIRLFILPAMKKIHKSELKEAESSSDLLTNRVRDYAIGDNISIILPLFKLENKDWKTQLGARYTLKENELETKLTALITMWNILRHFYPYSTEAKINWDALLEESLVSISKASTKKEIALSLEMITNSLHDGHAQMINTKYNKGIKIFNSNIKTSYYESELVVVKINASQASEKMNVGDVIISVDGISADSLIESHQKQMQWSAKLRNTQRRAAEWALEWYGKERVNLVMKDSLGRIYKLDSFPLLSHYERANYLQINNNRTPTISECSEDIYYVNMTYVNYKKFEKYIPEIQQSKGLILDFRKRPSYDTEKILGHFSKKVMYYPLIKTPIITEPFFQNVFLSEELTDSILPRNPYLDIPIVALTAWDNISYSETILDIVQHYKLATLVGESTEGTNGDANISTIPLGYAFTWTNLYVTKRDGSQLLGIGIIPDIEVEPTIRALREGRDEVLERAIKYIQSGK